nr:reverse transcriptase domain-containing protein [Tanacetum cinerariifolium]
MRTRSSSNLHVESPPNPSTSNLKRRNRRCSKQPFILEESPVDMMADQRTMVELLRAPTKGYAEAIMLNLIRRNMNHITSQQTSLDNSLVAPENKLMIERCNARITFTMPQKEETYQVTLDALKLSPCNPAFQVTTKVLEIYMHQFWNTIKKIAKKDAYNFKLDKKKCQVNTEVFCEILQICPRFPNQEFVEIPSEDDILTLIKELGYSGKCDMVSTIQIDQIHQPWRTFTAKNVDYVALLWEDFMYQADNKEISSARKEHMPYLRFTKVIINHFISIDNTISMRNMINLHIIHDDTLLGKFLLRKQGSSRNLLLPNSRLSLLLLKNLLKRVNELIELPKRLLLRPITSVVIRDTPDKSVSKNKAPAKIGRGRGIELISNAALLKETVMKNALMKIKSQTHNLQASGSSEGADFESKGDIENESDDVNDEDDDDDNGNNDGGGNDDDDYKEKEQDEEYLDTLEKEKSDDEENIMKKKIMMVSALETKVFEFNQTSQFAEVVSLISGIVDNYLASKLKEEMNVAVRLQANKLKEEAEAENQEFINKDEIIKTRMKTPPLDQTEGQKESQHKSSGKSTQVEEPEFDVAETKMHQDQKNKSRHIDDQPDNEANPKHDCKSLTLIKDQGYQVVLGDYIINNDLEYLKGGSSSRKYATSTTRTKAAKIIVVTSVKVMRWYDFGYLEEIVVRRDDNVLYKFKEGDFPRLNLCDIKDMLLLLGQKKLSNLDVNDQYDLGVALRMFTRRIVILHRLKNTKKDGYSRFQHQEQYEHVGPKSQDHTMARLQDDVKRLCLVDDLKKFKIMFIFHQLDDEALVDTWIRLKEMLRTCYRHGLTKGMIIQVFYRALDDPTQGILDVRGIFLYNTLNEAFKILEEKVPLKLDVSKGSHVKPQPKSLFPNHYERAQRDARMPNLSQYFKRPKTLMEEMIREWMARQTKANERMKNKVVELENQISQGLRNCHMIIENLESQSGDVKLIEVDKIKPIPTMLNLNPIMSNSPTVSSYLKDCTMHIPYMTTKTFIDDVLPNHVGDEELNSIDGVGTRIFKKKETKKDDNACNGEGGCLEVKSIDLTSLC